MGPAGGSQLTGDGGPEGDRHPDELDRRQRLPEGGPADDGGGQGESGPSRVTEVALRAPMPRNQSQYAIPVLISIM